MSQSPVDQQTQDPQRGYLDAWQQLAQRIQQGQSFSGRERNCCFLNTGTGRFADVSSAWSLDQIDDSRAVACVDWDQDGDLDLWETNRTGPRIRFLRNQLPSGNRHLTLQLVGNPQRHCPYDAIGARVVLETRRPDGSSAFQAKTLTAGDGFLSQSSKLIHFGLGQQETFVRVTIRWPGDGGEQTWTNLTPNVRYRLELGKDATPLATQDGVSSAAARLNELNETPDTAATTAIVASSQLPGAPSAAAAAGRLWFSQPADWQGPVWLPFATQADGAVSPAESRQGAAGQSFPARAAEGRALLIVLWASWCQPCLAELDQLGHSFPELQSAGLDVVALSVEGLTAEGRFDPRADGALASQDLASRIGWPFPSGLALPELVDGLDQLRQQAIYRQTSLPIPASVLLDGQGRVRAIYTGPLPLSTLRTDLDAAIAPDDPARDLARSLPFPGRWASSHFVTHPIAISSIYREEHQWEDAREYLRRHLAAEQEPAAADRSAAAQGARRRLADVHHLLGAIARDAGEPQGAVGELQHALRLVPRHLPAMLDLADVFQAMDRLDDAGLLLEQAQQAAPRDPRPANQLGLLALRSSTPAIAQQRFEQSLAIQPAYYPAANNLAWLLATHPEAKVRDGQRAVAIAQDLVTRVGTRADLLDTLAAAHAEQGQWPQAVAVAEQASVQARRAGLTTLANAIELRLVGYRSQQAYREPAGRKSESTP